MSVTAHPGRCAQLKLLRPASSSETSFSPVMVPTSVQTVLWHWLGGVGGGEAVGVRALRHCHPVEVGGSAFPGYRFPSDVILLAVRMVSALRLSHRDIEELLAGRGIEVDPNQPLRGGRPVGLFKS